MTKFTEDDLKNMVIEIPDKPVLERAKKAVTVQGYGQCDSETVRGMLLPNLLDQFRDSLADVDFTNMRSENVVGMEETNRSRDKRRAPVMGLNLPQFEQVAHEEYSHEKQQELMANQLKGMLRKIETEQKFQVAVPKQDELMDKLTMNNCTYFMTEVYQKKRNRVTILCELLGDVRQIAQHNLNKYHQVVQRREIDELLEEQRKLD